MSLIVDPCFDIDRRRTPAKAENPFIAPGGAHASCFRPPTLRQGSSGRGRSGPKNSAHPWTLSALEVNRQVQFVAQCTSPPDVPPEDFKFSEEGLLMGMGGTTLSRAEQGPVYRWFHASAYSDIPGGIPSGYQTASIWPSDCPLHEPDPRMRGQLFTVVEAASVI
ncbi:hypothetical protein CPB85DRAFT_1257411 [Mucidula mucida]|nr:hypothetical protein CPB85DRAFT_1257411 [Mucidula mucida]